MQEDLSMAGLSGEGMCKGADGPVSVQNADLGAKEKIDLSMAGLSEVGVSKGYERHASVQSAELGGQEQRDLSVAKLRDVECADCRRRMRRLMGWRVSNRVNISELSETGPSEEEVRIDEEFPDNFCEIISSKRFRSRKKSLLRKKIGELRTR